MATQERDKDLVLIANPAAGRGRARTLIPRIAESLSVDESHLIVSEAPGTVREHVRRSATGGYKRIVVAGGDGTVFEAVNGLVRAQTDAALGIIPVGTGNDFVKAAGIRLAWRDACRVIRTGRIRLIDIGRCNEMYFANAVGMGLDAEIGRTAENISLFRGPAVYLAAAFRTLVGGISGPEVDIKYDDGELVQRVTLVAVSNGSFYGGLFHIAPDASITDGKLDLLVADHVTRRKAMRLIPRVMRGEHLEDPAVRYLQTRKARVRSRVPLPVQIDGELVAGGLKELDIEVLPRRLRLIC